jgi:hypothetical protein
MRRMEEDEAEFSSPPRASTPSIVVIEVLAGPSPAPTDYPRDTDRQRAEDPLTS